MLFIDGLALSLGNWIYWLIISKMVLTSEVGQATTIVSLVLLGTSIAQMGLQYPLLKSAHSQPKIIGTTLVIELLLVIILVPVVFFQVNNWYGESQQEFALIAIMIVVGVVVSFVIFSIYVLLAINLPAMGTF